MAVYLAGSAHGPGVSTDAAMHLATADNLLRGRGLVDYRGAIFTQFPPLYSVILAFGGLLFRQDVFIIGWALNIIVFGAVIWFSGVYFYEAFQQEPVLAYFASFIVFSSSSLIQISANIASDPLFLLLTILFLMSMTVYLRDRRARCLWLAAALVIIACFQRYAGLSLAIAGTGVVVYANRHDARQAILRGSGFAGASAVPILLWGFLHNAPISGTAFGGRLPALPMENFVTGVEKVLYWFVPLRIIALVGPVRLLAIILGALIILLFATRRSGDLQRLLSPEVLPNIALVLVYSAVLIFDISYYELKGINTDRVHIIMLPALLIVLFTGGMQLLRAVKAKLGAYRTYGLAILLFVVWSSYPISKAGEYVSKSMAGGDVSSYNSINRGDIRRTGLARYLRGLDLGDSKIYTNGSDSAWFILRTQIDSMPILPTGDRLAYLKQHDGKWPGEGADGYLIWFTVEAHKESYATPEELSTVADLHEVYRDDVGTVYTVRAR